MKKLTVLSLALITLLAVGLLVGCAGAGNDEAYEPDYDAAPRTEKLSLAGGVAGEAPEYGDVEEYAESADGSIPSAEDRKLIRSAEARLETKEFDKSRTGIEAALASAGGHTQDSELTGDGRTDNLRTYYAVLRVPQDKFDAFVEGVTDYGNLLSLTKSGEDVTDSYFDNEARIKILEVEEAELLDLMKQAQKASDLFAIRDRISEIRIEIERLKGENIKTDNRVALSTVTITLYEVERVTPTGDSFWIRAGRTFKNSLGAFLDFLEGTALTLIAIAPFLLLFLAIAAAIIIPIRRRRKKKKAELPLAE